MAEQPKARRRNTREELIKAGVEEINRYGVAGFSMRRIAQLCGVSCGAPYKHFGDRKEFIAAIIDDVNAQWHAPPLRRTRCMSCPSSCRAISACWTTFPASRSDRKSVV